MINNETNYTKLSNYFFINHINTFHSLSPCFRVCTKTFIGFQSYLTGTVRAYGAFPGFAVLASASGQVLCPMVMLLASAKLSGLGESLVDCAHSVIGSR